MATVDKLHPGDLELARLVKDHKDRKDGGSYKALKDYYEAKYGKLPANSNISMGEIGENDSFVKSWLIPTAAAFGGAYGLEKAFGSGSNPSPTIGGDLETPGTVNVGPQVGSTAGDALKTGTGLLPNIPDWAAKVLGAAVPAIAGYGASGGFSGGGNKGGVTDMAQFQELMNLGVGRVKRQEPLHEAVTKLAMSLLPGGGKF